MSRFCDWDDYEGEPEQILAQGRWERNARAVLKSKRGRKALADLREALMALPEHRLIEGAMCTVGGAEQRLPSIPPGDLATDPGRWAYYAHEDRERDRSRLAAKGEGVCINGALAWWRKVQAGASQADAFATLPTLLDHDEDGADQLHETAQYARDEAGLTYTLAWELAYRNDEIYGRMTPEERWTAFVAWIDWELAGTGAAA